MNLTYFPRNSLSAPTCTFYDSTFQRPYRNWIAMNWMKLQKKERWVSLYTWAFNDTVLRCSDVQLPWIFIYLICLCEWWIMNVGFFFLLNRREMNSRIQALRDSLIYIAIFRIHHLSKLTKGISIKHLKRGKHFSSQYLMENCWRVAIHLVNGRSITKEMPFTIIAS